MTGVNCVFRLNFFPLFAVKKPTSPLGVHVFLKYITFFNQMAQMKCY